MKTFALRIAMVVVALLCLGTLSAGAAGLDKPLEIFEPLLEKTWVGGYVEGRGKDLEFTDTWEASLGGKEVTCRREVPQVPFTSETHFYWDREQGKVAFLRLNTKGDIGVGTVTREENLIVLRGRSLRPGHSVEFKTTLEILPDGRLRDFFYSLQNGTWVRGHHQEFKAMEQDKG